MLARKFISVLVLLLFVRVATPAQDLPAELPKCYSILVVTKDSVVDESLITPLYREYGFRIIRNGVYDLFVGRDKYFQVLMVDIDSSGFFISEDWYFEGDQEIIPDTVYIPIDQDIDIRLASIDNGVQGIPVRIRSRNYELRMAYSDEYCGIKDARIENQGPGHYYFTRYGWKKVSIIEGNPYIFENNTHYLLRRK